MGKFFSDKAEQGIELVWMQFDKEKVIEGQHLLQEAAEEGDVEAYCLLALTYREGSKVWEEAGLVPDEDIFLAFLQESVRKGSSCGILTILQFNELSDEMLKDTSKNALKAAYDNVLVKAEKGQALCYYIIGMCFYRGGYCKINGLDPVELFGSQETASIAMAEMAVNCLDKALKGKVLAAMRVLANLLHGEGAICRNESRFWSVAETAAELGDSAWQGKLGDKLYEEKKYKEALAWYERAAYGGEASAWYDMGFQYEAGRGTIFNHKKALEAYTQGAKAGNMNCQTRLGKHLLWGEIIKKDEEQAYEWFVEAAKQGDEVGSMFLGHCLFYSKGVPKEVGKGIRLLLAALNYNYPSGDITQELLEDSLFNWQEDILQLFWDLGDAYENGIGVPVKQHLAGSFFSVVAAGGWPEGVEKMKNYKQGMFGRWKLIK